MRKAWIELGVALVAAIILTAIFVGQASANTRLVLTDEDFICDQPIAQLATDGLPLRVVMNFTGPHASTEGNFGVVELKTGCRGDGKRRTTDLSFSVRGDGRTFGATDDIIRLNNEHPGARDLVITGRVNCGPQAPNAHQDGVQILGGDNILFRRFNVGTADGHATCQGAGGAMFYSGDSNNVDVRYGTYRGCNHALLAGWPSPNAQVRDATFETGHAPFCLQEREFFASNPCDIRPAWGGVTSNLVCIRH